MSKECKHKRIHTERLVKSLEAFENERPDHVIESICADCGKWIKRVDVTYK